MSFARTSSPSSRIAPVLAIAALVGGLWMAYQMASTAALVTRASAWPTIPATLDDVQLHHPGSASSRILSVAARYHYVIDGHTFTATRVSVYAPDSLGSFFQRTYDDLHARLVRHETVPAHVNPDAPGEAVLLPVWRPEVFAFQGTLMLVFGGLGVFVLARHRRLGAEAVTPTFAGESSARHSAMHALADAHGRDATVVDASERLPARAAWGRRLVLVGILLLGAGYVLLDRTRGDQFGMIDRLLASRVTATGTIFVSPPDDRVPALFEQQRLAQRVEARLRVEKREPQAVNYEVTLSAPDRPAALAALEQLQSAVRDGYRAQTGHDLTVFSSAYVAPVLTPAQHSMKMGILGGLILVGLACVGIGAWRSALPSA